MKDLDGLKKLKEVNERIKMIDRANEQKKVNTMRNLTKRNMESGNDLRKMLKMLNALAILLMIGMVFLPVNVQAADVFLTSESSVLSASLVKYDPAPVEPGAYTTIWVKLSNLGNDPAPNAAIEFVPAYPFSMDGSDTARKQVRLASQQDYIFEYKVLVDSKAVTGSNDIKFKYIEDTLAPKPNWKESTFSISVQASDATLTVTDVNVEGNALVPGKPAKLTLVLKNTAAVPLKNIAASLDLRTETTSTVTATSTNDVSIAPVGTTTQRYVSRLAVGETAQVSFDLAAYPDAKSKLYKIPLTLTFEDDQGTAYTRDDLVGVFVSSTPDIIAIIDSTDLTQEKLTGKVSIKVINKGLSDVKFLSVKLKPGKDVSIIAQSDSIYVGKLDSDDFETVEFNVKAQKQTKISVPVEVTYLDALNNQYSKTFPLEIALFDGSELGNGSGSTWTIIIVVLLIIGGVVYWRISRHKKKQH